MKRSGLFGLSSYLGAATVCGFLVLSSAPAFAQDKDAAVAAFKDGDAKFAAGQYQAAYDSYKKADDILPAGPTKYGMGAALDKLGKFHDAAVSYQTFLDTKPDTKKKKNADRVKDATARLTAIKAMPAKVKVTIDPAGTKVTVDAQPPAAAGEFTFVTKDLGKHKFSATAPNYEPFSTELDLQYGDTKDLKIALVKKTVAAPPPIAAVAPPPSNEPPPPPPPPAEPHSNIPAYVTLGLAGAGLVVGGIFGGMALGAKSTFDKTPTQSNADAADRDALISDMSFAVALTFGVTGTVLLLSHDSSAPSEGKTAKASEVRGFVTPYFGPNGGGAAARFTF